MKANATDESFMSAHLNSVGSSRNASKNRFFTAKHNRAHSNTGLKPTLTSRYRQGTIPTDNIKFSQFLEILFSDCAQDPAHRQEIWDLRTSMVARNRILAAKVDGLEAQLREQGQVLGQILEHVVGRGGGDGEGVTCIRGERQ